MLVNLHGKGMKNMSAALLYSSKVRKHKRNRIEQSRHSSLENTDKVQERIDEINKMIEDVIETLKEKRKLYKKEDRRDRNRGFIEIYDRNYLNIMSAVGGVALAAVVAAAASSYVTYSNLNESLTPIQMFALLSGPVTSSLLTGSGLASLLVRAGYFMDCNGKFQQTRRGRDAVKQALVQLEDYERTKRLRVINQRLDQRISELFTVTLRQRERWRVRRKIGRINREVKKIGRYVDRMERRDRRTLNKEEKDVGGRPSQILMSKEAKKVAFEKFEELGIEPRYAEYFLNPRGQYLNGKQTLKQRILEQTNKIGKIAKNSRVGAIIRQKVYRSTPQPLSEEEKRKQTCEQMFSELREELSFPSLFRLTQDETERTRKLLKDCMMK